MQITFLGTSGSMPTTHRGSSSFVFRRNGQLIMFECGEGTQRQMVQARIGFQRDMRIFISHLHGDHVLGLPGLLQSMSLLRREKKLYIHGPVGLARYVKAFSETLGSPTFPVIITEVQEAGIIYEDEGYRVEAIEARHRITAWSFKLTEANKSGKFHPEKAKALGIPMGPDWNKLQHGNSITLNGRIITSDMVTDPPRPGYQVVFSGDTTPTKELTIFAEGVNLLIHEATFLHELEEKAAMYGHTTVRQAAEIARKANVGQLILTHISSRYPDPIVLLDEAREVFTKVLVAEDLMKLELLFDEVIKI